MSVRKRPSKMLFSTTLFNNVLFSQIFTALPYPKRDQAKVDKIMRGFVWSVDDSKTAGEGYSNWEMVCRPKVLRGLCIAIPNRSGSALRLHSP